MNHLWVNQISSIPAYLFIQVHNKYENGVNILALALKILNSSIFKLNKYK